MNWAEGNKAASATALYGLSLASGWTQQMIATATGNSFSSIQALFANANIPAFAVGTNVVPRDMLAQIHKDEAIIPAAFNPWARGWNTNGNDNNQALIAEVRELRKEVAKNSADGTPIQITVVSQDGKKLAEQVISTIKERSRNREIVIYADGVSGAGR